MLLADQHQYWLLVDVFDALETLHIINKRPVIYMNCIYPSGAVEMGFRHR